MKIFLRLRYRRILVNVKIAWGSLCNFRLRTLLAIAGVFLGTFSLVVVANFSGSLTKKIHIEASKMGENLLIVRSGIVKTVGGRERLMSEATTLTINDAIAIMNLNNIHKVSPSSNKLFPVRHKNVSLKAVPLTGVMPYYPMIRNFSVERGTFFSNDDYRGHEKVVVLGKKVAERLFGNTDPLGKNILIFRVPCKVIGVMEEKGVDISGFDQDNQIFTPLSTFLRRFVNKEFINTIYVKVIDERFMSSTKTEIEFLLRQRHGITEEKNDDFTVVDLKDVIKLQLQASSMIKTLGRVAGAVSFIIGGIGILSIMMLIVNERKTEIGIRRAVGSRKKDIIYQFLMESSFISFAGAFLGLVTGFVASLIIFNISKLPFIFSPHGITIAFIASLTTGILAGIYPARKATLIEPVDVIKG